MEIDLSFDSAIKKIKILKNRPNRPDDDEMLNLYGLYKQSTQGDIHTTKPKFWNPIGKAKWQSWHDQKGFTQKEAQELYIKQVVYLLGKY